MLRLLIDQNLNHRILRGLRRAVPSLDCVLAQNAGLSAAPDPEVLAWAASQGYILVSHDLKTIPKFAYERVRLGQPMPGIIAVPDDLSIGQAITELQLIVECCSPTELENRVFYLPI